MRFWILFRGRSTIATLVLVAMMFGSAIAQPPAAETEPVAETEPAVDDKPVRSEEEIDQAFEKNVASFEFVWTTIKDSTWEKSFDHEGWQQMHDDLLPKITRDSSIDDVREILTQMLEWQDKSHYQIIPRGLYEGWESPEDESEAGEGHVGINVRLVDGRAVVFQVIPGSDAEKQAVQPGWILKSAKGKSADEFIERIREHLGEDAERKLPTVLAFALQGRLQGAVGSETDFVFVDGDNQERSLTLTCTEVKGEKVQIANLPEMVIRHEVRELPGPIGYFAFSGFFAPVQIMQECGDAIEIARKGLGLIIDVRGNGGGIAGMTMGIGNRLADGDEKHFLGTLTTRDTELKFVLIPPADPYSGPVAVLIDEASASSSEFLAGGLQAIGRARIFGSQSAGAALPSIVRVLPNGDRFQYAFAAYVDFNGRSLEGEGVIPDVPVKLSREALLEGKDQALQEAEDWIRSQADAE